MVYDVIAYLSEEIIREMSPVCGHCVRADHGPERNCLFIGTFVTHHTNALNRKEYDSGLPNAVIEALAVFALPVPEAADEYVVSLLEYCHLFRGDVAKYAYTQTRSRERMAGDEMLRHAELAADPADLVLEEPLERLTELEFHLLRQSAHIVMTLDDLAGDVKTLYPVRVYGALRKPLGIRNLLSLTVEDLDEAFAYYLPLLLRIGDTREPSHEKRAGVNAHHIEAQALIILHHILELVLPEKTVVHEYAGEPVAYGSVQKHCCHR